MEKEDFIETINKSIEGITKVSPSDIVFLRIEKEINANKVPTKTIWLVAASIVLLIGVNLALLNLKTSSRASDVANLDYPINKNNQLYK